MLMYVCSSGCGVRLACYLRAFPQILSPRVSLLAPFSRAVFMYFWSLTLSSDEIFKRVNSPGSNSLGFNSGFFTCQLCEHSQFTCT